MTTTHHESDSRRLKNFRLTRGSRHLLGRAKGCERRVQQQRVALSHVHAALIENGVVHVSRWMVSEPECGSGDSNILCHHEWVELHWSDDDD